MSIIQRFARNVNGRDFVVGDVHGCFQLLDQRLNDIGFDRNCDRLFSVGDLVDRGPASEEAIDWIAQPWFHAVRGNHEQMAIGVAAGRHDLSNYLANGGEWFLVLPDERKQLIANVFDTLPYAIEVDTSHGRVGIVHADIIGESWDSFIADLETAPSNNQRRRITETCLWSRARITAAQSGYPTTRINDVHALIVGHTPLKVDTWLENVHYIDTGAFHNGVLTIVQIDGPVQDGKKEG